MEVKFIEKGTDLDIKVVFSKQPSGMAYKAKFNAMHGETNFSVDSKALYDDFSSLNMDTPLNISFFRGSNMYSLSGKAKDAFIENGKYLVKIVQISAINIFSRRLSPRHEMPVPINIYTSCHGESLDDLKRERSKDDAIFSGTTFDLSAEGLCVLSNSKIEKDDGLFIIEITLNKVDKFVFFAKMTRRGNASQSVQFKYDYGFLIDFKGQDDQKARLVTSIFKQKMSGI